MMQPVDGVINRVVLSEIVDVYSTNQNDLDSQLRRIDKFKERLGASSSAGAPAELQRMNALETDVRRLIVVNREAFNRKFADFVAQNPNFDSESLADLSHNPQ
jgi:hypothetical protein